MKNSILIIIPYFGPLPSWFHFFIESCKHNPQIDWCLFTDQTSTIELPPNVRIKHLSFEHYCALVSEKLNINFNPSSAYKLCDLKPCLAAVHNEEVQGYTFWGFGDVDVIYGDLKKYISEEMLQHDLISFHNHRVSGHLCLLRNSIKMNYAFKKYKHWQTLLSDPNHRCFDEKDFNAIFIKHKNWPVKLRRLVYFFNSYMRNAFFKEAYTTHFSRNVEWKDGSQNFPRQWRYDKSIKSDDSNASEIPYLHFMVWKKAWGVDRKFSATAIQLPWLINEEGFFKE